MNFLIDTNIVIPLEPGSYDDLDVNTENAILLHNLINSSQNKLCVHPAISYDLANDKKIKRAKLRKKLVGKYYQLPSPPDVSILDEDIVGSPPVGSNDYVDNCYIVAVFGDAVDFLITEDNGIHSKARRLGIESRVLKIQDAINLLRDLFDISPEPPPTVKEVYAHQLNDQDELFLSLHQDYPEFPNWFKKCKRQNRKAYTIRYNSKIIGILIIKREENLPSGPIGKTLKLCTFKVADDFSGNRYGELLFKTIFEYTEKNNYDYVYFTVYPKYGGLIAFAESFGFEASGERNDRGEVILCKALKLSSEDCDCLTPLDIHIKYGPRLAVFNHNSTYVVPIKPEYHEILFPEVEAQRTIFDDTRPCGNSIKKAYLCNSSIKKIKPGDNLLFYRSHDFQSMTILGVVEDCLRGNDPRLITRYVGTRTVYTFDEILRLCEKSTLAIKFRFVKQLNPSINIKELVINGVLKSAPQSISEISNEGIQWIREKIGM
jgi:GNAT superfamily N-acetyltransferase